MAERQQEVSGSSSSAAPMCANSCGFFGNAATKNLCSKCYKEHLIKTADAGAHVNEKKIEVTKAAALMPEQSTGHDADAVADKVVLAVEQLEVAQIYAVTSSTAPAAVAPSAAVKAAAPNRCASCRKKVGLLGFPCRCGATFCSLHRYAEKHACDFDFKTADREKIANDNPHVVAAKLNKI